MRSPALAALAALLLVGCITDDDDRDKDRPKAEERAEKYCVDAANALGWRVDKVGRIEKVAKKQYEVKLRVSPRTKQLKKADQESDRVICRYDDENRQAIVD